MESWNNRKAWEIFSTKAVPIVSLAKEEAK